MVVINELVPQNYSISKPKKQRNRNRPRNKHNRIEDSDKTVVYQEAEAVQATSTSEIVKEVGTKSNKQKALKGLAMEKTREQIMADREAKKKAKQNKQQKNSLVTSAPAPATTIITEVEETTITTKLTTTTTTKNENCEQQGESTSIKTILSPGDKTRDQIKAEREAKKAAKQAAKVGKMTGEVSGGNVQQVKDTNEQEKKKSANSKAERRAIQEAQRAAKAQALEAKLKPVVKQVGSSSTAPKEKKRDMESPAKCTVNSPGESSPVLSKSEIDCKVKLFNHLICAEKDVNQFVNDPLVHPSVARLGEQYAKRVVVGSNARCIGFLNALRQVVQDFETPAKKEFSRSLDVAVKHHVDYLHRCRPLAVSVSNAYKQFKNQLTLLPTEKLDTELKEMLNHFIDTYIENQIGKAAQAISSSLQEKITDGDILLTFGCSSLIHFICEEARRRQVNFRVIVVDSRPFCEGQEMLRRLHANGIPCTYVLINAISYVMQEATKVLLGAHALLANGYVMARIGTAQVALVANSYNVPVLVCCETHKFSERFQTDAIVYNELGDPNELVINDKCCLNNWQTKNKMTPLNLNYDITPPELVSAVVTEVAILPCTSVPVILRIKPDIGY